MVTYIKEDRNFNQDVRNMNKNKQGNNTGNNRRCVVELTADKFKDAKIRIPYIREVKNHLKEFEAPRQWWVLSDCDNQKSGFDSHKHSQSYVYGNKIFDASKGLHTGNLQYSLGVRPAIEFNGDVDTRLGQEFEFNKYIFYMVSNNVAVCKKLIGYTIYSDEKGRTKVPSNFEESILKQKLDAWWSVVLGEGGDKQNEETNGEQREEINDEQNEQGNE